MDCAKGCRSVGWNGDQYVCLRRLSFLGQKCTGSNDDDCFVISIFPFPSRKAETVRPRVVGRRFGVGLLSGSDRRQSANPDLSNDYQVRRPVVRQRLAMPNRSRT